MYDSIAICIGKQVLKSLDDEKLFGIEKDFDDMLWKKLKKIEEKYKK